VNERLKSLVYYLGAESQRAGLTGQDRREYILSELRSREKITAAEAQLLYDQTYADMRARKQATPPPASLEKQISVLESVKEKRYEQQPARS